VSELDPCLKKIVGDFDPDALPPRIDPVTAETPRPLWSVMIPTYNCAKYLEKTLESVLCQDLGPDKMQIQVVDDCSTQDDPEAVTRRIGKGRIQFSRNEKNTGLCSKNFNQCLRQSTGTYVHLLHGDDFVLPGFYASIENAIETKPFCGMVINRSFTVNEKGEIESLAERGAKSDGPHFLFQSHLYQNTFFTPGLVFRRAALEKNGGFREDLVHCADWEITARIYTKEGSIYLNDPKACYRIFKNSDTNRLASTGENVRDYIRLLTVFEASGYKINRDRFLINALATVKHSCIKFKKENNSTALKHNEKLEKQIFKHIEFKTRMKLKLSNLKEKVIKTLNA